MDYIKSSRKCASILAVCLLLIGCISPVDDLADHTEQPGESITPAETNMPAEPTASATPTYCVGWHCEIKGVVYSGSANPGNELEGVQVNLSQISWCSPTAGEQETQSGPNGTFAFEVYIHDTDSINMQVDFEGYQTAKAKFGGFDCLYCSCPLVEIVLEAAE